MNTEISNNGTEVYVSRLYMLADEYIQIRLKGKEEEVSKNFRDLIFYIADRISVPDNEDIEGLDNLFGAYTRFCARFGKLPTLECFSFLTGINNATFTDWKNQEYRASSAHSKTVQKWKNICKSFVIDELSNSHRVDPNLIFIAKAAHGMRETAPVQVPETGYKHVLPADAPINLLTWKDGDNTKLPELDDMENTNES